MSGVGCSDTSRRGHVAMNCRIEEGLMTGAYDALASGGGHHGLTCAFCLVRAGLRVRVLERRHVD
jgi:ribulose 1,5-bisphosphate synthetase/thiazole synthase